MLRGTILSKRYLISEQIGSGGMGSVYRAIDLRTGGEVAVKVPHPPLAGDPAYIARLRREAQIAASLSSPRIVRVMDLDTDSTTGTPFLVMEYVPGRTLADVLAERGGLPTGDALTVALGVARALDAAAQNGVEHRDLKPSNIKLVDGEVKVLDFGIARAEGVGGITAQNLILGTAEYCAPERISGEGDARSDIYSLGVILFEMLVGQPPFAGRSAAALFRKHETEPPPELPLDVPAGTAAIVRRCLAKRPEERFQQARDLVDALVDALAAEPAAPHTMAAAAAATAPRPTGRDRAPWSRRRFVLGAATAAVLGAAVILLVARRAAGPVAVDGTPAVAASDVPATVALALATATAAATATATVSVPAGATAVPTATGPSGSPAATTVTPVAIGTPPPVVVAALPVASARNDTERAILDSLNRANRVEVEAYRTASDVGLDGSFTGSALADVRDNLAGLRRLGRYAVVSLQTVDLLSIALDGADAATVITREHQDYDEYAAGGRAVDDPARHFSVLLRWTYHLVARDGHWLVTAKDYETESSVQR